jgi:hypothetical protein
MKHRPLIALLAAAPLAVACQGLKEALTAHVDVVARAESQELSVNRVADLLGKAKLPIPVTRDNAGIIANLWVNYQLMAHAAAHGDSLTDRKAIDAAVAGMTQQMRLQRFMETVVKGFPADSGSEASYASGAHDLLAARHILIMFPGGQGGPPPQPSPAQDDSVRKKAESVRAQVNAQNFAQMAGKYSDEPNAGQRGGSLGVFEKGQMIPEFSNAVAALKPGEISPPIRTVYGYHIIQRLPYADVKAQYQAQYAQKAMGGAEEAYVAKLDSTANVQLKSNAATLAKEAVREVAKHRKDDATLASYKGGSLTVGEFVRWVESFPPQARIQQQLPQVPDTAVNSFVKSIAQREVLLQRADSAKIGLDPQEQAQLYQQFGQMVQMVWEGLGVTPKQLADSGKTPAERERIAALRVEEHLDKIVAGEAQPVPVPPPLEELLHEKYQWSTNPAGLDRATEAATKVRAAADSVRAQNQPKSEVPLPGMPGTPAPRDSGTKKP